MAKAEQIEILKQGVELWNEWRSRFPHETIDLSETELINFDLPGINLNGANLSRTDLTDAHLAFANLVDANLSEARMVRVNLFAARLDGANLNTVAMFKAILELVHFLNGSCRGADLRAVNLRESTLNRTDFEGSNLREANLSLSSLIGATFFRASLIQASFRGANIRNSNLNEANLTMANLSKANLTNSSLSGTQLIRADCYKTDFTNVTFDVANLQNATLVETILEGAVFKDCKIYGISAWALQGKPKTALNFNITANQESQITVDDIQLGQFVYLLLNNINVRSIIDTITSKVVLILGRFTEERKRVLDAIREELRKMNLTPIIFDFEKPVSKDLTGTVETLARLARFIITDLTNPSSGPHELASIVPHLRTTPVLPIRLQGAPGYTMFSDFQAYPWVLPTHEYKDAPSLIAQLADVIAPANAMAGKFRSMG